MLTSSCPTGRAGIRQWFSFRNRSDEPGAQSPAVRKNDFYKNAMLAASGSFSEGDFSDVLRMDVDSVN